ncbi:uncharacterized protein PGTG_21300 [Puccinia graminis f. sp. tritici CRL 75-36-700-3]|uniref:Uncharacterized protein n=1 Tax=Puccinia graminis f. sp. tritici (strain CRL 75-36-700-3 / race SCCL) TaxID=418459 RepID=H6QR33_PUCGT|nr:uncharacterized protein PGTG_21300 [Puccinia graminis f. sp. tritici CRL 75-36-700-3]EHS63008.1 hypothetical protein PGTG_21300 [Puccinia graminis f. sp. tritici CRL 75-36-700-3]
MGSSNYPFFSNRPGICRPLWIIPPGLNWHSPTSCGLDLRLSFLAAGPRH